MTIALTLLSKPFFDDFCTFIEHGRGGRWGIISDDDPAVVGSLFALDEKGTSSPHLSPIPVLFQKKKLRLWQKVLSRIIRLESFPWVSSKYFLSFLPPLRFYPERAFYEY